MADMCCCCGLACRRVPLIDVYARLPIARILLLRDAAPPNRFAGTLSTDIGPGACACWWRPEWCSPSTRTRPRGQGSTHPVVYPCTHACMPARLGALACNWFRLLQTSAAPGSAVVTSAHDCQPATSSNKTLTAATCAGQQPASTLLLAKHSPWIASMQ